MMKLALLILVLLPAIFAAPADEKRFILDTLGGSIFDIEYLRCDMQIMVDALGGDPTEQKCEDECHNILQEGHVLNYSCAFVCHAFQALIHLFDVTPDPSGNTPAPCMNGGR